MGGKSTWGWARGGGDKGVSERGRNCSEAGKGGRGGRGKAGVRRQVLA